MVTVVQGGDLQTKEATFHLRRSAASTAALLAARLRVALLPAVAIFAFSVALSLAGAGAFAGIAEADAPQVSKPFRARVNDVCRRDLTQINSHGPFPIENFDPVHPQAQQLPQVGAYFAKDRAVTEAIPGEMSSLGEPALGRARWDALRGLVDRSEANALAQLQAANASDAPRFVSLVKAEQKLHERILRQGKAAGFSARSPCSHLF